jgi:hypothetical protein
MIDDNMLVTFGFAGDNIGFNDVNILSTSTWSWVTQYTANVGWLSGNTSSTNGVIKNNTGNVICFLKLSIYSITNNTNGIGNGTAADPNSTKNDTNNHDASSQSRIKAGIVAGVVSGGVVIVSQKKTVYSK